MLIRLLVFSTALLGSVVAAWLIRPHGTEVHGVAEEHRGAPVEAA